MFDNYKNHSFLFYYLNHGLAHFGEGPVDGFFLVEDIDLAGLTGSMFYGTFTDVGKDFLGSVLVRFVLVVGCLLYTSPSPRDRG